MTNVIGSDFSSIQAQVAAAEQVASNDQSLGGTIAAAAQSGSFSAVLDALTQAESAGAGSSSSSPSTGTSSLPSDTGLLSSLSSLGGAAGPSGLGTGTGTGVTGGQVVADAERYLGVPYQWGGTSPTAGFDCSGFVQHVYGDLGISLPRTSEEQATVGQPVDGLANAQPGDLLFFEPSASGPGHVGIYIGNGQMIDAPHTGTDVQIQNVTTTPCEIRRILPSGGVNLQGTAMVGTAFGSAATAGTAGATSSLGSLNVPTAYAPMFLSAAGKYGVPAQLLAAVAQTESGFDPNAVSSAGAEGMMQIMPSTAAGLGVDPMDPAQAINGAAQILAGNLRQFGGSVPLALAAYNAGAGAVEEYGGIPPYPETQAYVQKITSLIGAAS